MKRLHDPIDGCIRTYNRWQRREIRLDRARQHRNWVLVPAGYLVAHPHPRPWKRDGR